MLVVIENRGATEIMINPETFTSASGASSTAPWTRSVSPWSRDDRAEFEPERRGFWPGSGGGGFHGGGFSGGIRLCARLSRRRPLAAASTHPPAAAGAAIARILLWKTRIWVLRAAGLLHRRPAVVGI